ncbi:DUF1775 domain-containing protein [Pseudooceanicola nanhaiensis]|uniref:DUF1775 domain-containing protein n=1 Tax=Pseudooceanicola nanhaiensis TaxID=375761 RepID=UPI00405899F3
MIRITVTSALLAAAAATSALAHATLEQKTAAPGETTKITLRVPHGCDGEATHTVRLTLPDGFYAAKPMPKPGWDLSTEDGPYATPYDNHGTEMTSGLRSVTWSNGHLEDGWYDEFTVRGTFGAELAPETVMVFPAVQTCANGTADWTDTSGSHDVPNPAPSVTLVAATGSAEEHAGHGGHGATDGAAQTAGALEITGGFSRATLPNAPVGGGFLTIVNTGTEDDRLVSASAAVAGRAEVHEMTMADGVMQMRPLPDGLPIPAGGTVELRPGGHHLMLMDLKEALVEGETVEVTLTFETAGEVVVPLAIGAPNARGAMDHSGHMKKD